MEKKRIVSIVVMIIGLITLVVGAVFLILKLTSKPAVADGEYLVSAGNWILEQGDNCELMSEATSSQEAKCEDGAKVIWNFTEIGKGTLTTNNHLNDYSFAWALQDGRMLVQTDWLYKLDNEYEYTLNQGEGVLTLSDGENEFRFVAQTE